jgi:hypothetical protein
MSSLYFKTNQCFPFTTDNNKHFSMHRKKKILQVRLTFFSLQKIQLRMDEVAGYDKSRMFTNFAQNCLQHSFFFFGKSSKVYQIIYYLIRIQEYSMLGRTIILIKTETT